MGMTHASNHKDKVDRVEQANLKAEHLPAAPLTYHTGDATRPLGEGRKILVHVCNNIGAWGRGFVLAISRRWPEPERHYRAWHRTQTPVPFELGEVQFVPVTEGIVVANLIGQYGIRSSDSSPPVRYDAIRAGLRRVASHACAIKASVHMPRIGCGLAGGDWSVVEEIVRGELTARGIQVTVYDLPSNA